MLAALGCTSASDGKEKELQNVAKDWSLVIRASQVIPVYPLTEDLQPGDVFVVDTPIDKQAAIYRQKGFLPLDRHATRLTDLQYETFYGASFFDGVYGTLPHERRSTETLASLTTPGNNGEGTTAPLPALPAPRAAFPSYTFEVNAGEGVNLALPVQGVPVGLSLLKTESAVGSITLSDAYTYGVSGEILLKRLRAWVDQPEIKIELSRIASATNRTLFLRIVNRVYIARGVTVSLMSRASKGAGADVGDSKAVNLPAITDRSSAMDYNSVIDILSKSLQSKLPGGSIRLAQANERSVTLSESFDRPVVIGYVGFDVPITKSGGLGAPIATLDQLEQRVSVQETQRVGDLTSEGRQLRMRGLELHQMIEGKDDKGEQELLKSVTSVLVESARSLPGTELETFGKSLEPELQPGKFVSLQQLSTWIDSFMEAAKRSVSHDDDSTQSARTRVLIDAIDKSLSTRHL